MSKRKSESVPFSSSKETRKSNDDDDRGDRESSPQQPTIHAELSAQRPIQTIPCPMCPVRLSIGLSQDWDKQCFCIHIRQEDAEGGDDDTDRPSSVTFTPYKSPFYLDHFRFFLDHVLEHHDDIPLTVQQLRGVQQFRGLPLESQMLYVRLYMRKYAWFRVCKLIAEYKEIGDIQAAIIELIDAGFIINDGDRLEELQEVLNLLNRSNLQVLARKYLLKVSQSKEKLVQALLKHGREHKSFGHQVQMTEIICQHAKKMLGECIQLETETKSVFDSLKNLVDVRFLIQSVYGIGWNHLCSYDDSDGFPDPLKALTIVYVNRKGQKNVKRLDSAKENRKKSSTQPTIPEIFSTESLIQKRSCPTCVATILISVMLPKEDELSQQWQEAEAEEGIESAVVKKKPRTPCGSRGTPKITEAFKSNSAKT